MFLFRLLDTGRQLVGPASLLLVGQREFGSTSPHDTSVQVDNSSLPAIVWVNLTIPLLLAYAKSFRNSNIINKIGLILMF